ncbi:MAG: MurR/RpiR family transcriptional regulator [Tissierellia bacterium]|nr:MurR/RpiR family transcriptional regulator [Tissierellia bacterium]
MDAMERIRQLHMEYTATEEKVADYILNAEKSILGDSAEQLAKKVGVSAATVIRFAKKTGYSGFTDLKFQLAKLQDSTGKVYAEEINTKDNLNTIIQKTKQTHLQAIEQSFGLINEQKLEKALSLLENAKSIYLIGVGASGIICDDLYYKFARIDRKVHFNKDPHIQLTGIAHGTKEDLLLAISYSGETTEVITGAKYAKKQGMNVLSITKLGNTSLKEYSDLALDIPATEGELRLGAIRSRISTYTVTDLLFYSYAMKCVNDLEAELLKTKEIIEDLKL